MLARLVVGDRTAELIVEERDRVRERVERGLVRGIDLGSVCRPVDKQHGVTIGTDGTVTDLDDLRRRKFLAADLALPCHADRLWLCGRIHAGMSCVRTCSFVTAWTGQRGASLRPELQYLLVTTDTSIHPSKLLFRGLSVWQRKEKLHAQGGRNLYRYHKGLCKNFE